MLAIYIRGSDEIKGINIRNEHEIKLTAFADDMTTMIWLFFFLKCKTEKHNKMLKKKEKKNLTSSYNITPESNIKVE